VRPKNQSIIWGVALCHQTFGRPWPTLCSRQRRLAKLPVLALLCSPDRLFTWTAPQQNTSGIRHCSVLLTFVSMSSLAWIGQLRGPQGMRLWIRILRDLLAVYWSGSFAGKWTVCSTVGALFTYTLRVARHVDVFCTVEGGNKRRTHQNCYRLFTFPTGLTLLILIVFPKTLSNFPASFSCDLDSRSRDAIWQLHPPLGLQTTFTLPNRLN
jgi:hypothetical protein